MLFICGSRPKGGETEKDLLFRRMKTCWMENERILEDKMKEALMETDIDSRWARFSLIGAPLVINPPKFGLMNKETREDLQKIFSQENSEGAARIQKYGFMKAIPELVSDSLVIHKWDLFPDRNPAVLRTAQSKKTFRLMIDNCDVVHHVILHGGQSETLHQFYQSQKQEKIQLVQQDWSQFISMVRGKESQFPPRKGRNNTDETRQKARKLRIYSIYLSLMRTKLSITLESWRKQYQTKTPKEAESDIDIPAKKSGTWPTMRGYSRKCQRQRGPLP